jgi:hypothetical protein
MERRLILAVLSTLVALVVLAAVPFAGTGGAGTTKAADNGPVVEPVWI